MQPKHARTKSTVNRVATTALIILLLTLGVVYWAAHTGSYTGPYAPPAVTTAPHVTTPPVIPHMKTAAHRTYTVRAGDTLWGISQHVYHDPLRWRILWQHNLRIISDPNLIYPGQILQLE